MISLIKKYNAKKKEYVNDSTNRNSINKYIDQVYVINLENDQTRYHYIKMIMAKLNINYCLVQVSKLRHIDYQQFIINCNLKGFCRPMTIGEAGCYLSHMYCLNDMINQKHSNCIIFEDDVIFSKQFHNLFDQILLDSNQKIPFDFLMLGAGDFGFNQSNNRKIENNKYIPANRNILGTYGLFYSNIGASKIFDCRLKLPVYMDKNILELFNLFDPNRTGICYPCLVTVDTSSSSLNHNFGISKYQYNDFYYSKCYHNFKFEDFHFIYLDLFPKYMLEETTSLLNLNSKQLLQKLLQNYFNNQTELAEFHLKKLDLDLFSIEQYQQLLKVSKNKFTQLYYQDYKEYCQKNNITSGYLLLNNIDYNSIQNNSDYSFLFHKDNLDSSLINNSLKYQIVKSYSNESSWNQKKKITAILYSNDINSFNSDYQPYMSLILDNAYMVIVLEESNSNKLDAFQKKKIIAQLELDNFKDQITVLMVPDKGSYLGGYMLAINYLNQHKLNNNYILFLHNSLSSSLKKIAYDSLVNNLIQINQQINQEDSETGGFFPPIILKGNQQFLLFNNKYLDPEKWKCHLYHQPSFNKIYLDELDKYLGLFPNDITIHSAINCFILNFQVAKSLFNHPRLYHNLNRKVSDPKQPINNFDYNWIKSYYQIPCNDINFIYKSFKHFKLIGNGTQVGLSDNSHLDQMIENIFNRVIFRLIVKHNLKIKIISCELEPKLLDIFNKQLELCFKTRVLYQDFPWENYLKKLPDPQQKYLKTKDQVWNYFCQVGF